MQASNLISPSFFGCGVTLGLLLLNRSLPNQAYYSNLAFFPLGLYPLGYWWKQSILPGINGTQFPPEMKSYRELFLHSRKAIVYELFLNQVGYHSLVGFLYMGYTYLARTYYDKTTKSRDFTNVMKDSIVSFLKLRFAFASVSLLTEFWGVKFNAIKNEQGLLSINANTIRILLAKETLLNFLYFASVAELVHLNYVEDKKSLE